MAFKFTLKLLLTIVLVSGFSYLGAIGFGTAAPMAAQASKSATLQVQPSIILVSDGLDVVELKLQLINNSDSDVISQIILPNPWKAKSLKSFTSSPLQLNVPNLNDNIISFNLLDRPILPKTSQEIRLELYAGLKKQTSFTKTYFSSHWDNLSNSKLDVVVAETKIKFPESWGDPFLNLQADKFKLETASTQKILTVSSQLRFEAIWGRALQGKLQYKVSDKPESLFNLIRETATQKVNLPPNSGLKSIYTDDWGNLFSKSTANTPGSELTLGFMQDSSAKPYTPQSVDREQSRSQLPKLVADRLPDWQKTDLRTSGMVDSILNSMISFLASSYEISQSDPVAFSVTKPSGLANTKYATGDYLLTLVNSLRVMDIDAKVVFLQRDFSSRSDTFALQICTNVCENYNVSAFLPDYQSRLLDPYSLEVLAFSELNPVIVQALGQIASKLPQVNLQDTQVLGATDRDVNDDGELRISLQLPAVLQSFYNFNTVVDIDNRSSSAVYLEQLTLEDRSFDLTSGDLGHLREGVLPGTRRSFSVSNLFLSKIFFGNEKRENLDFKIQYNQAQIQKVFTTKQTVTLEQNYPFIGLSIILLATILIEIFLVSAFWSHNHLSIKSIYWKLKLRKP